MAFALDGGKGGVGYIEDESPQRLKNQRSKKFSKMRRVQVRCLDFTSEQIVHIIKIDFDSERAMGLPCRIGSTLPWPARPSNKTSLNPFRPARRGAFYMLRI